MRHRQPADRQPGLTPNAKFVSLDGSLGERDLTELLSAMRFRERNSQLLSLSDVAYAAGLRRIERDFDDPQAQDARRASELCHGVRR